MAAIPTGHEVQICRRCGWPYPNPHPSARHRRAHKKICGTVEGYKISDSHLPISDDDHVSEEEELTPNPKLLKKAAGEFGSSGSGIGGRSNRSEDDVFSDAVTEFSDSGVSPLLEQRSLGGDFVRSTSLYFDTTTDTPEQINDSTRSAQGASDVGIITGLQPDLVESGIVRGNVAVANISEYGNGKSLEVHMNDNSPAITLEFEEDRIPDPALSAAASKDELCNKLVSDVAVDNISEHGNGKSLEVHMNDKSPAIDLESEEGRIPDPALSTNASKDELCDKLVPDVIKHDQTETLQDMDAPAEVSDSIKIVGEIAPFVGTREGDTSVGAEEVFHSNENIASIGADDVNTSPEESLSSKPDGSIQTSSSIFATEQSEAKPVVSSTEKKVEREVSKDELRDKLVSDVVKHDQTETLQNMDAPAEISDSIKIVGQIAPFVGTREGDTSVGAEEVLHSNENIASIGAAGVNTSPEETRLSKPDGSIQTPSSIFTTEQSEAKPVVSSTEKKVEREISVAGGDTVAGNSDASDGGMRGNENWNLEESGNFSVDTVGDGVFESGDGDDRVFEKNDVNHSEESSSCKILGTINEKGEGASVEVRSTVDPTNSTELPSSADLEESFKTESRDNGFEKPLEGLTTDQFTEVPQPVDVYPDLDRDDDVSDIKCSSPKNIHVTTGNVVSIEPAGVGIMTESKDNNSGEAVEVESEGTPREQRKSELVSKDESTDIISENSAGVSEESIDAVHVKAKSSIHNGDEEDNPSEQESSTMLKKCVNGTSADVGAELTPLRDVVVDVGNVTCAADSVTIVHDDDDATSTDVNSNTLPTKSDDGVSPHKVGVAVTDPSAKNSSSVSDSLEGNCGSVSDAVETNSQNPKATTADESAFEPPSFMTLVQSGGEGNHQVDAAVSEIETVNNDQRPKADAVEAGWFPSLTNVVNESEGRKKNEEMIAKVTKWSPVKQQGSLKNLLNEVKSPKEKHTKGETDESKADVAGPSNEKDTKAKEMEQWNSPARYPIEIKKQKKKGRSYWVPFVCCSSVHRDL